jgi:hypothetical protein
MALVSGKDKKTHNLIPILEKFHRYFTVIFTAAGTGRGPVLLAQDRGESGVAIVVEGGILLI